ncbi:MAG: restriction endonuclease subunit S [Leptolyngbya sp. SIO1E4]|nr:restriction endonuclease subunit S [Leptolyngbya sp. SIO1E4]
MKSYSAYEPDSRLPGIEQVPIHWSVLRNSVIFKEVNEAGYGELQLLSILADRGVVRQSDTGRKERAPDDRSKYKRILKGDIGYNLMNAFMGAIGVSNYDGIISPAYAVCRPKIKIEPEYFHHLFRTGIYLIEFDRNAYGIMDERNRLYFDAFKRIYVPFPPLNEQKVIVKYIDQKLAEIDQFISYKRRLIELLNEQKTVLINQAVTQGLDPTVSMKPSGIDWLGDIPTHWERLQIRRALQSYDYGISDSTHGGGSIKVLKMGHVHDGVVHIPDEGGVKTIEDNLLLKDKDLLFNRTNSPELVGKVGLFRDDCTKKVTFASYLVRLRVKDCTAPEFLNYLLNSHLMLSKARQNALHSLNQSNLNPSRYSQMEISLPPFDEQIEIISFIERESEVIDCAIAQAEKEIELIQEYRTTLISDAVTGKIDVRDKLKAEASVALGGVRP